MAALAIVGLCGCDSFSGKSVQVDYGESKLYTKEDIDAAVDVIKEMFDDDNHKGVILDSLSYGGDDFCRESNVKDANMKVKNLGINEEMVEVISFGGVFHTLDYKSGLGKQFPENYVDEFCHWYLARGKDGKWILYDAGYC